MPEQGPAAVVFVSEYFYPEDNAASHMVSGIASELARRGFDVQAIAAPMSYHERRDGASNLEWQGVEIRRIKVKRFPRHRALGRVLNTLLFSAGVFWRCARLPRRVTVIANTNPPSLHFTCAAAALFSRTRLVAMVQDLYPDIAVALGAMRADSLVTRAWTRVNAWALQRVDAVVTVGEDMRDTVLRLMQRIGTAPRRIGVIEEWADEKRIIPLDRDASPLIREFGWEDRFVLQFAGNMGRAQDIPTLIEAARLLDRERFGFVFIGDGVFRERIEEVARAEHLTHVRVVPFQTGDDYVRSLAACDASVVTLDPRVNGLGVPSKFYSALASGRPIITTTQLDGQMARLVTAAMCGVAVAPADARGVVAAAERLAANRDETRLMGQNARRLLEQRFTLERCGAAWADLIRSLD